MPKLKTHALTNLTGAVKNLYGLIGGKRKTFYHKLFSNPKEFSELLLDIYNGVKPQLNIMDGIIGIEGFGPGPAGEKIKSNLILASKNAIALDIVSSEIIGFKAKEIPTNKIAIEKNIFNDKISIVGNAKNIKINFKKPFVQIYQPLVSLLLNMIPSGKVTFYNDRCIKCRRCEKNCPNKAIELSPYPICIHKKCIKCFCCTEICPKKSVYFRENLIYIYVRKVYGSLKKVMEK